MHPENHPSDDISPLPSEEPRRYTLDDWSLRERIMASIIFVAVILGIVLIGVVVPSKASQYPDYDPLHYVLIETYSGPSFFDKFNYFSDEDPTGGFVQYVNQPTAQAFNLTTTTPHNTTILQVDTTTHNPTHGRSSVRIESKRTYDAGLFIFDILHTPHGCGTWPALWLTDGYNWPANGEIDVLEAVNNGTMGNMVSLHTTEGCKMDVERKQTGSAGFNIGCDQGVSGCGVMGGPETFGEEMNRNEGGIYALELRPDGIRTWFFARASIPPDLIADEHTSSRSKSSSPDPSTWGPALADFPGTNCDTLSHFRNLSIIVNIDLCGEYAGDLEVYKEQFGCPRECRQFVARNPGMFTEAYWEFSGFRVYQGYG
ncbi:concanavalin A-like lectin/glucanase domain-containing protein [Aspergillus cavernicola]|uniref:Concanavalin A-like lectin/glucanase domain-containing protein n=1 Tax=Aspergillus cavernicola TaxID=176166 RepID=A0ABR4IJ40_9EURO